MFLFYETFMLAFWVWHYQAHHKLSWIPWNTACRKYHKNHHWIEFPPDAFYGSDTYWKKQDTTIVSVWGSLPLASSAAHEALLYTFLVIILAVSYYILKISTATIVAALFMALVIGVVGNYLHMSFHDKDHWLQRFEIWRELRIVHYEHHKGTAQHNYSMANFMWDWLLGSYHQG